MILKDKVAIVTGSSRGIGRAVALEFAKEGANVTVVARSSFEAAEETTSQIRKMGREAITVMTDIKNVLQVNDMISKTLQKFGKIDILVNNAGVADLVLFSQMSDKQWDEIIEINLKGVFNCIKATIPHMINQRSGKIINTTSPAALVGAYAMSHYAAAKGGIISLTRSLAREVARYRINVNCIAPTANTEMFEQFKEIPKYWERMVSDHPLGLQGPEIVAPIYAFLASEGADYITGQVIHADGGFIIG